MKYIQKAKELTVKIEKEMLFNSGKYVSKKYLASSIHARDTKKEGLRNMFYNGCSWNKYNMENFGGVDFIDVKNPMKAKRASLMLTIEII